MTIFKKFFMFLAAVLMAAFALPETALAQGYRGRDHRYGHRSYQRSYYRSYGYRDYGYYGRGGFGYSYHLQSGIKFHLDSVPEDQREAVKRGVVTIDGNEMSIVNRHDGFWNGIMYLEPGSHEIIVMLENERQFVTTVSIQPGIVRPIYIRFQK